MTITDQSSPASTRGLRWLLIPITIFILSRAAIFAVAGFSLLVDSHTHREPKWVADSNLVVQALSRWDGEWFTRIAHDGYDKPINSNFFPLFPFLGRYVSQFTGLSIPAALVVIANVCSFFALIVVYRIFLDLDGEPTATAALALLVAWPFSFFQATAYPESLMMLMTGLAVFFALRHRHFSAGVALGLGILARHLSAIAGLTLLAQQIRERGLRPSRVMLHRDFLGLLIPLIFGLSYLGFLQYRFGSWGVFIDVRTQAWGESAVWGIRDFFTRAEVRRPEIVLYVILSILPAIGAIALLFRSRWRVLAAFALCLMLLLYAQGVGGLGRYSASCWPAFLPLGAMLANRRGLFVGLVCALAMLQGMMLYLFAHVFTIL